MLYFESENELTFYNLEARPSQYSWINTTSGKERKVCFLVLRSNAYSCSAVIIEFKT